jgi:2'-5' RNA ligase
LAFLGSVDAARQDCFVQAAERVQGTGFTLQLDEAGHFPRPQVVWLGASQMPAALQSLQANLVSELMRQCGFEPEARPFVPHMTLWRKVRRIRLPENLEPIDWSVSRFVLASSRTLPSGAQYSIVQEWPLSRTNSV